MQTLTSTSAKNQSASIPRPGVARRRTWAASTLVLCAVIALAAARATAADFYWSGLGAISDYLDQDDNWSVGNAHPSAGDNLYFNNTAGPRHSPTSNFGAESSFDSIITYTGAGGIKWRGDTTLALKFENNSDPNLFEIEAAIGNRPGQDLGLNPTGSGGIRVDNSVTITDARQIQVSGANTLTFAGPISGSSATLAILTGATVILTNAASYTGDTYVNSGTLRLSVSSALPNSGNFLRLGNTTGSASANLILDGGRSLATPINVRAGNSGVMTLANAPATVGAATFSGNLSLDHDATLYANSPRSNLLSGAVLDLKDQTLTADGAGTNYMTGVLQQSTGSGKLTKNGAGTLMLVGSGNNTYRGPTTVNAGWLTLGKTKGTVGTNAFGGDLTINGGTVSYLPSAMYSNQIPDTANVTVNSGGTLDFGGHFETIGQTNSSPAGSFVVNGGFVTVGNGTVRLAANPSITAGLVWLTSLSSVLELDQELVMSGGKIDFPIGIAGPALNLRGGDGTGITYPSSGTTNALIADSGKNGDLSLNINATTVFTVADVPGAATELQIDVRMWNAGTASAIRKEGLGKLLLTAINPYSGATTISAGELAGDTGGSCANSAFTVCVGATNGVRVVLADSQWTCKGLTYNAGTTYANFDFFSSIAPSTNKPPLLINGSLTNNGTVRVVVRGGSSWVAGRSYPLMKWTGTGPADLLKFSQPMLPAGLVGNLSLTNKTINLNIGIYAPNLSYTIAPHIGLRIALSDISSRFQSSQSTPSYAFTGVSATSTQGGTVACNSGTLLYTGPSSGSSSEDSFTYTITDGNSTATAMVSLVFTNAIGGSSGAIRVSGGVAAVTLYGIPGLQYDVQRSPDLNTWTTLGSPPLDAAPPFTAAGDGTLTFTDTNAPGISAFYRTLQH
jgi:fibronectin-binding autotransporter adhesin